MNLFVKYNLADRQVLELQVSNRNNEAFIENANGCSLSTIYPFDNRGTIEIVINNQRQAVSLEKVLLNTNILTFGTDQLLHTTVPVDQWTDNKLITLDNTIPLAFPRANTIVNFGRL